MLYKFECVKHFDKVHLMGLEGVSIIKNLNFLQKGL